MRLFKYTNSVSFSDTFTGLTNLLFTGCFNIKSIILMSIILKTVKYIMYCIHKLGIVIFSNYAVYLKKKKFFSEMLACQFSWMTSQTIMAYENIVNIRDYLYLYLFQYVTYQQCISYRINL